MTTTKPPRTISQDYPLRYVAFENNGEWILGESKPFQRGHELAVFSDIRENQHYATNLGDGTTVGMQDGVYIEIIDHPRGIYLDAYACIPDANRGTISMKRVYPRGGLEQAIEDAESWYAYVKPILDDCE